MSVKINSVIILVHNVLELSSSRTLYAVCVGAGYVALIVERIVSDNEYGFVRADTCKSRIKPLKNSRGIRLRGGVYNYEIKAVDNVVSATPVVLTDLGRTDIRKNALRLTVSLDHRLNEAVVGAVGTFAGRIVVMHTYLVVVVTEHPKSLTGLRSGGGVLFVLSDYSVVRALFPVPISRTGLVTGYHVSADYEKVNTLCLKHLQRLDKGGTHIWIVVLKRVVNVRVGNGSDRNKRRFRTARLSCRKREAVGFDVRFSQSAERKHSDDEH